MATLNDKIVAYLSANAISVTEGMYHVGYNSEEGERVVHWDESTLGAFPEDNELDAAYAAHVAAENAIAYKSQRAAEYPPIGDQLDALFHAGLFPAEMAAQIQAVKDAYPKPE